MSIVTFGLGKNSSGGAIDPLLVSSLDLVELTISEEQIDLIIEDEQINLEIIEESV